MTPQNENIFENLEPRKEKIARESLQELICYVLQNDFETDTGEFLESLTNSNRTYPNINEIGRKDKTFHFFLHEGEIKLMVIYLPNPLETENVDCIMLDPRESITHMTQEMKLPEDKKEEIEDFLS
jgi:hypothetical protein